MLAFVLMASFRASAEAVSPERLGLGLVDVSLLEPAIVHDVKYATDDNFTGETLYPSSRCLLREPVARRLVRAHHLLRQRDLGLKVYDCYRPLSVQRKMWALVPDEDFVANPATGSRHNRGASVDVGLVDSRGVELPMPSAYDEFSDRSRLDYPAASTEQTLNRQVLQTAMRQAGFLPLDTEWWHFDAPEWRQYGLADADARLVPPHDSSQVLAVADPVPGSVDTFLWAFEKTEQGWRQVPGLGPIPAVVGRKGLSAFDGKREGDGMTPRGIYALKMVFGYAAGVDTRMPYRQSVADDVWIDDPASPRYNHWVKGIPAHESHERMRRDDALYQLGIVIGYNTDPVVAGRGSAIFLHVWKGPGQPTSGCVAVDASDLARIAAWLDPRGNPRIILGFREES